MIPNPVSTFVKDNAFGPIVDMQPVGGGCISNGQILTTQSGTTFFLKSNRSAPSDMFVRDQDCEINYGSFFDGNGCWYEIADDPGLRIYKFNGTKYVLWSNIPSQ